MLSARVAGVPLGAYFAPQGLPLAASQMLDEYLQFRNRVRSPQAVAARSVQAAHPWAFTGETGDVTFGDGLYFRSSYNFPGDRVERLQPPTPLTPDDKIGGGAVSDNGLRPPPYPPEELWCVTLDDEGGRPLQVVMLALHRDAWVASWIAHELPGTAADPQVRDTLDRAGCDQAR